MDRLGGGSKIMQASRLFAVLWLFCASFAMQVISVGQSVSPRSSAGAQAGNVSDTGPTDRPVARQVSRGVPLSDLRFIGERADAKPTPGSDPSVALPSEFAVLPVVENDGRISTKFADAAPRMSPQSQRIRAPPLV